MRSRRVRSEPTELPLDGTFPPVEARRFVRREEPPMDAAFSGAVFMALCAAGLLALLGLVLIALALGALSGTLVV